MKKSILHLFILAALASSCGKATKGKVTNDWKVTSYAEDYSYTDVNDEQITGKVSIDQNNYSLIENSSFGNSIHNAGSVTSHNYTIRKDGTWSAESDIAMVTNSPSLNMRVVKTASGTWSFVGKSKEDDIKKNERILFNTFNESKVSELSGSMNYSLTENAIYLAGEKQRFISLQNQKQKN